MSNISLHSSNFLQKNIFQHTLLKSILSLDVCETICQIKTGLFIAKFLRTFVKLMYMAIERKTCNTSIFQVCLPIKMFLLLLLTSNSVKGWGKAIYVKQGQKKDEGGETTNHKNKAWERKKKVPSRLKLRPQEIRLISLLQLLNVYSRREMPALETENMFVIHWLDSSLLQFVAG